MDFARSRPDTGIGDRGSGAALLSVPAGTAARRDRHDNHRRLPAWHGQRRQRVCTGFPGCFLFWGRLREFVAGVAWRRLLLLCAGEVEWETAAGSSATARPQPGHAGSQLAHGPGPVSYTHLRAHATR